MKNKIYTILFLLVILNIETSLTYSGFHQFKQSKNFDEHLIIKSLKNGQLSAHFQFRTFFHSNLSHPFGVESGRHVDIFPLNLLQLFDKLEVQEFHFSLTKGYWKYNLWGLPPRDVSPNANVWAWFDKYNHSEDNWKKLTSSISGQYCASINLIHPTVTIHPRISYRPFFSNIKSIDDPNPDHVYIYHASLPQEAICTENLTPFIKMLPCKREQGIGKLLNAVNIFDSQFFSMSTDFQLSCSDITNCEQTSGVELKHEILIIMNSPGIWDGKFTWSLNSLFGYQLESYCPLATTSRVYVDTQPLKSIPDSQLITAPTRFINFDEENLFISIDKSESSYSNKTKQFAEYDLKQLFENQNNNEASMKKSLNIGIRYPKTSNERLSPNMNFDQVKVQRNSIGIGLSTGGIEIILTNNLPIDIEAIYLDSIPWYLRMYLHTMSIKTHFESKYTQKIITINNKPLEMYYEPARDRIRPHTLEIKLYLPANSKTEIRFDFDHQYLRWTEFPPDPNHGLFINPATVTFLLLNENETLPQLQQQKLERFQPILFNILKNTSDENISEYVLNQKLNAYDRKFPLRLFTEPLIILMPTPDFSMPYNVICLVSTALSIAFGPIYNLTTRVIMLIDNKTKRKAATSQSN